MKNAIFKFYGFKTKRHPWWLAICLAFVVGCQSEAPKKSQQLQIHANHLKQILPALLQLENTPAQRWAQALQPQLTRCPLLGATGPAHESFGQLLQNLKCLPESLDQASIGQLKINGMWWDFQLNHQGQTDLSLKLQSQGGSPTGPALWLPADQQMDGAFLSHDQALMMVHGRSDDGLGLYGPLMNNAQVQDLFEMASMLGTFLADERWALAIYAPTQTSKVPLLALAAGIKNKKLIQELILQFEKALSTKYQLRKRKIQMGDRSGTCFSEVPIFPQLAPCVLIKEEAVVFAWNEDGLKQATAKEKSLPTTDALHGHLDLQAISNANAMLNDQPLINQQKNRVVFTGNKQNSQYRFQVNWRHGENP